MMVVVDVVCREVQNSLKCLCVYHEFPVDIFCMWLSYRESLLYSCWFGNQFWSSDFGECGWAHIVCRSLLLEVLMSWQKLFAHAIRCEIYFKYLHILYRGWLDRGLSVNGITNTKPVIISFKIGRIVLLQNVLTMFYYVQ